MNKLLKLDGLRGVLVVFVFLTHAVYSKKHLPILYGQAAVFFFFLLSGFLISISVIKSMNEDKFNMTFLKGYTLKRLFRIYPVYLSVLGLALLIGTYRVKLSDAVRNVFFLVSDKSSDYLQSLPLLGFTSRILTNKTIIAPTWTLIIEIRFYIIVLPIVYFLLRKQKTINKFFLLRFVLLLMIANVFRVMTTAYAIKYFEGSMYGIRMPLFYLDLFLGGILVAMSCVYPEIDKFLKRHIRIIKFLALTTIISMSFLDVHLAHKIGAPFGLEAANVRSLLILPCAVGGSSFLYLLVSSRTIFDRILESKVFVFLGTISYSFYITHWIIILYIDTSTIRGELSAFLLTIIISTGFYNLIELPFMNLGHRLSQKYRQYCSPKMD